MQQGAERAVDQPGQLVQGQVPHVSLAQVELHPRCDGQGLGLPEHRGGGVNAGNPLAGRPSDGDGDPPVADRQLDQRPVRPAGQVDVEGNVGRHLSRPFLVPIRERLVPAHPAHVCTLRPGRAGQQAHYHHGTAPVCGEAFVMGQGETAIALMKPRNLIGFPGVFVAVAIGVIVRSPLATQTVLPSGVIARK